MLEHGPPTMSQTPKEIAFSASSPCQLSIAPQLWVESGKPLPFHTSSVQVCAMYPIQSLLTSLYLAFLVFFYVILYTQYIDTQYIYTHTLLA